jgi:hypothetical protein
LKGGGLDLKAKWKDELLNTLGRESLGLSDLHSGHLKKTSRASGGDPVETCTGD